MECGGGIPTKALDHTRQYSVMQISALGKAP
jgi:hypothetical protein